MAGGIPLVATAIHSHTQVLDEEVAFLARPEADDLARALVLALSDPALARRKAEAAQALYARKYARPVYVNKLRQVLESLK